MTKKNSSKHKRKTGTEFMYPELHEDVANAVFDEIGPIKFHRKKSSENADRDYSTNIRGKFICNNNACSSWGWSSGRVAILIRKYPRNEYNAVVFGQRCKSCNKLGSLKIDEGSYVDRLAYRLKKWAGLQMDQQVYTSRESAPHESALCEGCRRGVCQQANRR